MAFLESPQARRTFAIPPYPNARASLAAMSRRLRSSSSIHKKVFASVNLKRQDGFRDYAMLHLLYDSGARASEAAGLNLSDFDPEKRTLAILGKANRYRLLTLWPQTAQLLTRYIKRYRPSVLSIHEHRQPLCCELK
jgi:site-specific recombinase XerD